MKRRALGQHYLVDEGVLDLMVAAAGLKGKESVVEIGTGKGALTERLALACSRLDGYEIDPENYRATVDRVGKTGARIHLADAFSERPRFEVLVSSLPYSRSLEFIEWISQVEFDRAVVLLQRDFVDKILSPPGSRDYRGVSAIAQISSEVRVLARVGVEAFSPQPRVSSVIVRIRPRLRLAPGEIRSIKILFSLRRRTATSALAELQMKAPVSLGTRRVYSLTPEEVHGICSSAAGA